MTLPPCRRCTSQPCESTAWHGCYDGSWKGLIVDEAFAHPAKFAYGLVCRIVDHGLREGYWKPGDLIGDPFGGVGLGGIICGGRGLNWIGVEIEERFVELGNRNLGIHGPVFMASGASSVKLVQGDSRRFAEIVGELAAVVTSPPWQEQAAYQIYDQTKGFHSYDENEAKNRMKRDYQYGQTPGQIGSLPAGQIDGAITSPPYAETVKGDHGETETAQESRDKRETAGGSLGQSQRHGGYGVTVGQIGALKSGEVSAILPSDTCQTPEEKPSPGGTSAESPLASVQPSGLAAQGECNEDVLGVDRRVFRGRGVHKLVQGEGEREIGKGCGHHDRPEGKGSTGVDAAVSQDKGHQHSDLLAETVQEQVSQVGHNGDLGISDQPQSRHGSLSAGSDSVPSRETTESQGSSGATDVAEAKQERGRGESRLPTGRGDADSQNSEPDGVRLSQSTGRTGKSRETYWEACAKVYSECHKAIRPNGILVVVLKDYVSKGKRVPLCDDTRRLLESLGFHVFERTRAWLVKETGHPDLFGGADHVQRTERKSFFRRLAEKKGSPRIDWEMIIWARRLEQERRDDRG